MAGEAVLYGRGGLAQLLSPTGRLELQEFSQITTQAAAGTLPRTDVAATDYVYETLGTWRS